jgi:Protein of unknown function (DUF2851)
MSSTLITEKLLHFIWQFQRFNFQNLVLDTGEKLQIIQIGQLNTNAGPDFLEAKIQINEIVWAGNVEIHIKGSDWTLHNHEINPDYDSVILHVVWENDKEIARKNGQTIPILSLKNKVEAKFIADYQHLMACPTPIPCFTQFERINSITKMLMLEKVLINRLERKAEIVTEILVKNKSDWEETTYQLLAKTMGFGLNAIPFERLAKLVPLKILQKHNDNIIAIEALLFGTAGFLEEPIDEYSNDLKKEYQFLKAKYSVADQIKMHEWKFMRLRPANFPTVRIAQFAQIIKNTKSLFSYFLMFDDVEILKQMFNTKPTTYWQSRIKFGESTSEHYTGIGKATIENILINTVTPILVAYSLQKNEPIYIEKAMNLLEKLKSENNKITRFWETLKTPSKTAFDSQALIELHNEYCVKKQCLNCNIGMALLK